MMAFSQLLVGLLSLATTSILAFELALYPGSFCLPTSDMPAYHVIKGASNGDKTCYNLSDGPDKMELLSCVQYAERGAGDCSSCTGGAIFARSVRQSNGGRNCGFFSQRDCKGERYEVVGGGECLAGTDVGVEGYQSFMCEWDCSVDKSGVVVTCEDGMSADVCVNDCDCGCSDDGEFVCTPGWIRCNPTTVKNCRESCYCKDPCKETGDDSEKEEFINLPQWGGRKPLSFDGTRESSENVVAAVGDL